MGNQTDQTKGKGEKMPSQMTGRQSLLFGKWKNLGMSTRARKKRNQVFRLQPSSGEKEGRLIRLRQGKGEPPLNRGKGRSFRGNKNAQASGRGKKVSGGGMLALKGWDRKAYGGGKKCCRGKLI